MEVILLVKAAIMGVVEGLTEFLPISSTGHLILAASLLNFTGEKIKVFEIAIQTGAMFAVIWEYRARLKRTTSVLQPVEWRDAGASTSSELFGWRQSFALAQPSGSRRGARGATRPTFDRLNVLRLSIPFALSVPFRGHSISTL